MPWYKKEQPTPFDNEPIPGLYFVDGRMLALLYNRDIYNISQQKYPYVEFPSGEEFPIWEGNVIHIFGEMDLSYYGSRDEALEHANDIAEACGYAVRGIDEDKIEVWGHDDGEHFLLTFDEQEKRLLDITPVTEGEQERPVLPAYNYLPTELLEALPKLGETEELGMLAVALVKYFTPDADWTWYATEYNPDEGLFFGLVSGFEVELGYFSLAELKEIRGRLGLPIERDLYYKPLTLEEIKKLHQNR